MQTLKQFSIVKWLKSRHNSTSRPEYLQSLENMRRNKDILQIFKKFDEDGSGSLEMEEISKLFTSNGIYLGKKNTKKFFALLDNDNSGSLTI